MYKCNKCGNDVYAREIHLKAINEDGSYKNTETVEKFLENYECSGCGMIANNLEELQTEATFIEED